MAGAELVGGPAWRVSGVGSPRPPAFFCGGRCVFEFAPRTGTSVAPAIAAETVRLVETKKRFLSNTMIYNYTICRRSYAEFCLPDSNRVALLKKKVQIWRLEH